MKGDEVIVEPGSYGTPGAPLSTHIESGAEQLDVHGVDVSPGPASAKIYTEAPYGIRLYGAGTTIRDLEIEDTGTPGGGSLLLENASGEHLIVRANAGSACVLERTSTLSDSLCQDSGSQDAVLVTGALTGPNSVTLRNVTAIGSDDGIYVATIGYFSDRPSALTAINTIARGGVYDIQASEGAASDSVVTSHSNYSAANTKVEGGATITDDGTSQTTGNQTTAQLFVDPAAGNFRELLGAETIGAGLIDPANGGLDFEGDARVFAQATSCASTDIGADQFVPASSPSVATGTVSAVGQTGATLSGTVNPLGGAGTAHFDYAPAAAGGGPPTSFISTATQCLPVTDVAQPVTTTVTGLEAGTTYYYRLVAANASATTTPASSAIFTTAGLPPPPTPTSPRLTGVKETARIWREGKALAHISTKRKLPLGTTFSFALNESASVTFTFTEPGPGRKVGIRCVAPTHMNKHNRPCTRTVIAGRLTFSAHAGMNMVRFQGRLSTHKTLSPGSYTALITATASGKRSGTSALGFKIAREG